MLRGPEGAPGDGLLVRREREAAEQARPVRLLGLVDELRVADPVRADGRDRDAALCDLHRQRAAVAQEERLRRRIRREIRDGLERCARSNLEYAAALLHVRQRPLREFRRRAAVQRDHAARRRRPDIRRHPDAAKASRIDEIPHDHWLRRKLPQPLPAPRHQPELINRLPREEPSKLAPQPARRPRDERNALFIRHPYPSLLPESVDHPLQTMLTDIRCTSVLIVVLIPFSKLAQPFFNRRRRLEVKVALQFADICIRLVDVTGLHWQELLLRRLADSLLQDLDEMHELLRLIVADVVDLIAVAQLIDLRRITEHMLNARHNIIDVRKVTVHVAVVVDLDRFSLADLVGEFEISHIRASERTVDREEAQARRRDAIEMTVRIHHELIRLLRRCVETDGMVDIVCRREGRLLLVAVNRRARCKEKMLYLVMAAGFKNIEEADDVGIDIRARMVNAVPHTSLCRQVDDNIRLILLKECRDRRLIRQVTLNERELRILAQDFQATLLQPDIVIVIDSNFAHLKT